MSITLTPAQYASLNATAGASKRLAAACSPGAGDSIILAVGAEVRTVLEHVNAGDLADAATRVRWVTLRSGALHASPRQEPQGDAQDGEVAPTGKVTKGATVLALLQRPDGATNAELCSATGWQPHSVRGFFAGAQLKRTGYKAERFIRESGDAAYRATKLEG